ncbi:MAG: hypothetical protein JWQ50_802 [Caballeronia mineralivorans]|nr:hypothetical protein [Caballeronia mineralivorans]MEA3102374.1 hypothetical protein [Caballeronia mineralivorans]
MVSRADSQGQQLWGGGSLTTTCPFRISATSTSSRAVLGRSVFDGAASCQCPRLIVRNAATRRASSRRGIAVSIVKRKGPMRAETISIELRPSPVLLSLHGGSRRPMHETVERPDTLAAVCRLVRSLRELCSTRRRGTRVTTVPTALSRFRLRAVTRCYQSRKPVPLVSASRA